MALAAGNIKSAAGPMPSQPTQNFRFSAKNIFLTYPRCDVDKEDALAHFNQLFPDNEFKYTISREQHQDGGYHLHVLLSFSNKLNIRNASHFDLSGFHPNIQPVRSLRNVDKYTKKDKDYISTIEDAPAGWADAVAATSRESFLQACKEASKRDWILQQDRIISYANTYFPEPTPTVTLYDHDSFRPTQDMIDWAVNNLFGITQKGTRKIALALIGPSRIGKTAWARSLTPAHVYWNGMTNLDDWVPNTKLVIFDDFDWNFFPCKKGFLGGQHQFTMTDKYRKKKTIIFGGSVIVLSNHVEPAWISGLEKDWYQKNIKIIEINEPLF